METEPGNRIFVLSPAYDLLPVNLILPEDTEETALTVNGRKRNLHRNDFIKCAVTAGLNQKAAVKMIDRLCSRRNQYIEITENSFLPEKEKERLIALMNQRIDRLKGSEKRWGEEDGYRQFCLLVKKRYFISMHEYGIEKAYKNFPDSIDSPKPECYYSISNWTVTPSRHN